MVVLSDGQPADSKGGYDIYGYTRHVVSSIEKNHQVEIYGIGIMDYTVEHIYKNSHVINDPSEIQKVVIDLLKDRVLRSNA